MSQEGTQCLVCGVDVDPDSLSADEFLFDRFHYISRDRRPRLQLIQPPTCERHIMRQTQSKADIEYAVMLAILNFHTEFMKSRYTHVQVHMFEESIDVVLTRSAPIPAEERLVQSRDGETLLREAHEAIFKSCQEMLKQQIERVVGRSVRHMVSTVDPVFGRSTITIGLQGGVGELSREGRMTA